MATGSLGHHGALPSMIALTLEHPCSSHGQRLGLGSLKYEKV
ncbi:hypothetical protein UF75_2401 [Desulfosporosinus sp. I2]|nr:hypothetical protein UF75_2401 [Desulfosporosinus sp. I2]